MQRAATILLSVMIMAPSCKGLFLKKMFSISGLLISASMVTPVSTMSAKVFFRVITINAPCLMFDMEAQAWQMLSVSSATTDFLLRLNRRNNFRSPLLVLAPMVKRKRRISGWKMMMSAMKPTLTKAPRMVDSSSIWRALTICQIRKMATMPMKMLMAAVPLSRR